MAHELVAMLSHALPTALIIAGTHRRRSFSAIENAPGELLRIDKIELQPDPQFEHPVHPERIRRIADNWSWLRCGTLIVARRPRMRRYIIIEGRHRWEAARLRPEIIDLPCLCFTLHRG